MKMRSSGLDANARTMQHYLWRVE